MKSLMVLVLALSQWGASSSFGVPARYTLDIEGQASGTIPEKFSKEELKTWKDELITMAGIDGLTTCQALLGGDAEVSKSGDAIEKIDEAKNTLLVRQPQQCLEYHLRGNFSEMSAILPSLFYALGHNGKQGKISAYAMGALVKLEAPPIELLKDIVNDSQTQSIFSRQNAAKVLKDLKVEVVSPATPKAEDGTKYRRILRAKAVYGTPLKLSREAEEYVAQELARRAESDGKDICLGLVGPAGTIEVKTVGKMILKETFYSRAGEYVCSSPYAAHQYAYLLPELIHALGSWGYPHLPESSGEYAVEAFREIRERAITSLWKTAQRWQTHVFPIGSTAITTLGSLDLQPQTEAEVIHMLILALRRYPQEAATALVQKDKKKRPVLQPLIQALEKEEITLTEASPVFVQVKASEVPIEWVEKMLLDKDLSTSLRGLSILFRKNEALLDAKLADRIYDKIVEIYEGRKGGEEEAALMLGRLNLAKAVPVLAGAIKAYHPLSIKLKTGREDVFYLNSMHSIEKLIRFPEAKEAIPALKHLASTYVENNQKRVRDEALRIAKKIETEK